MKKASIVKILLQRYVVRRERERDVVQRERERCGTERERQRQRQTDKETDREIGRAYTECKCWDICDKETTIFAKVHDVHVRGKRLGFFFSKRRQIVHVFD